MTNTDISPTATMHVRCPVRGCHTVVNVEQGESWGDIDARDYGCITITAHGAAISDHMRAHTDREREAARKEAAK